MPIKQETKKMYYFAVTNLTQNYSNISQNEPSHTQYSKQTMTTFHDFKIQISTIAAGLYKRHWPNIKQIICSEFWNIWYKSYIKTASGNVYGGRNYGIYAIGNTLNDCEYFVYFRIVRIISITISA